MKTLDDALKTPGVIRPDSYDIGAATVWMHSIGYQVNLGGHGFTPEILRRIADHLDPPATEEPRGCPLQGVCACSTATLHIDRVKAEARRAALKEAISAIPAGWDAGNGSGTRVITPDEAAAAIRALIEKETEV